MDLEHGLLEFEGGLRLHPQYTLEDFKKTEYYMGQDRVRRASLGRQRLDGRDYQVTLVFQEEKLYLVSLIAQDADCDREIYHEGELARKQLHDSILLGHGIVGREEFPWGRISSDYDDRENVSSITLVYEPQIILVTDAKERNRIVRRFSKVQPGWDLQIILGTFLCCLGSMSVLIPVYLAFDYPMNGDGVYVWTLVGLLVVSLALMPGINVLVKAYYEYGLPYSSYANGTLSIVGDTLEYSFWKVGYRNPAAYGWKRATYSDYFKKIYTIEKSNIKDLHLRDGICTIKGLGMIQSSPDSNEKSEFSMEFSFIWAFPQENAYQMVEKWYKKPAQKPKKAVPQHQGTLNGGNPLEGFPSFMDYWNGTNGGYAAMPDWLVEWYYEFSVRIDQLPTFTDLGQRFYLMDWLSWTLMRDQEESDFSAIPEREMERNLAFVRKHKNFFLGLTKDYLDEAGELHLLPRFAMPYLFYRKDGQMRRVRLERARCSRCGWQGRIANPNAAVIYIGSNGSPGTDRTTMCCPKCNARLEQDAIWLETTMN